jgi:hypothetical protein
MARRLRERLTYSNVVATLALFIALGGASAYAVGRLPTRSVGAKQLRPGAVTADKIRKHAVTAPKLEAKAVKSGKLANGAVKEAKLANGSVTNSKLGNGAVTAEKIAPGAVTGAQLDEGSLTEVPSAARATSAAFAESANPAAFAAVSQEGDVDSANSKGQISVQEGKEAGVYCVSVAGFSPRGAQVTPRYNGSGNLTAYVTIGGTGSCPAPQVEVQTHNGGPAKAPFYIVLYR